MSAQTREENWDQFWKLNTDSRFTKKSWSKNRIMTVLKKHLKPGLTVLDAGSGSGFFSNFFLSEGCSVYSLDYSQDALAITRKQTEGRCEAYLKENLLDEGFGSRYQGKFDLIFTDGLFEHFSTKDQRTILNNFRRSKKTAGLITTFVPNRYSWWEIVRPLVMPGIHEIPFTRKSLLQLHADMEVVESGGLNVLPFAFSPDRLLGKNLGMILYCFAK